MQQWGEALRVVAWGFPLSLVAGNASFEFVRARIGRAIAEQGQPVAADFSEVSAAALLVAHGADSVEYLEAGPVRTPDLRTAWGGDRSTDVEVEVTNAAKKDAHEQLEKFAGELAEQVHGLNLTWDVAIHIADRLRPPDVEALLEAARTTAPGSAADSAGRWHLQPLTITRSPGVLFVAGQSDAPPEWWDSAVLRGFAFRQMGDTPNAQVANPQVRITYGIPVTAYINPVEKKAARVQGSGSAPLLVAADVTDLPAGFGEFRRVLPDYFPHWTRISGVLIFRIHSSVDRLGWRSELHVNPHARMQLPAVLVEKFPHAGQSADTFVYVLTPPRVHGTELPSSNCSGREAR